MQIRLRVFKGTKPRVNPKLVANENVQIARNCDLGYLSDVANYQVKIRRAGYYQIVGNVMFTNPAAYSHYVTVDGSNLVANNTPGNTNGCSSQATGVFNLGTGALIKQTLYQATGSSQNTYVASNPCSLTVVEIPKW